MLYYLNHYGKTKKYVSSWRFRHNLCLRIYWCSCILYTDFNRILEWSIWYSKSNSLACNACIQVFRNVIYFFVSLLTLFLVHDKRILDVYQHSSGDNLQPDRMSRRLLFGLLLLQGISF